MVCTLMTPKGTIDDPELIRIRKLRSGRCDDASASFLRDKKYEDGT
jgi:hypothetical protein